MAAVRFEGVRKVFSDGTAALKGLTLEIADGEFVVLVGPSGCGKTTALRLLAGLERLSGGDIWIGDRLVNDFGPGERDIAMVFQNYALYPHMTVRDNLAFGLKMRRVPKRELNTAVVEIARVLGIEELLARKPRQLSGGQRQRVAMGRAMVRSPSVFLMDEPLSNLDAKLRVEMRSEVSRIQRELRATTLYVTHDQVEAMTMGDRVAVLRKGELQQVDYPQRLYDSPVNLFVATFMGSPAMNVLRAELQQDRRSLRCRIGKQEFLLPADVLMVRPGLQAHVGRPIAVGIRPEHIEDAALVDNSPSQLRLQGHAAFTESLGSELNVHIELPGEPVLKSEALEGSETTDPTLVDRVRAEARKHIAVVIGRFDTRSSVKAGERVEMAVEAQRLHFFDLETGVAIQPETASTVESKT